MPCKYTVRRKKCDRLGFLSVIPQNQLPPKMTISQIKVAEMKIISPTFEVYLQIIILHLYVTEQKKIVKSWHQAHYPTFDELPL